MRLTATRSVVTGLPLRFSEAEFDMRRILAPNAGSELTTRTTWSSVEFGSDSTRRTRTAISGNEGRSTRPAESSAASDRTNANAVSLPGSSTGLVKIALQNPPFKAKESTDCRIS